MTLEHLFDAELKFRPGMDPVVPASGREGQLIGSGDGTVRGAAVRGTIRWSNFETQGERVCGMHPAGLIETDDGATLRFDARGWALRWDGDGGESIWEVAGGLRFETEDRRYEWLTRSLAVWEGRFDAATGRGIWRIHGSSQHRGARHE
ncbi:MAG: DUF3237 family protein [Actinomycetota bacterium]